MKSTLEFIESSINYCKGEIENDAATAKRYTFTIDLLIEIKERINLENSKIINP